ncbi:conserved hypothetical protein; putative membrane protein [Cupriavidus phytorum]|uniref:CBU-0592-like domain-containing protein n=2 Tax=Cupriavidus TaxID=106589 RepID=A0A975XBQ3_9BURK|nr:MULTISPECIES: hypothetical protein [Cupriavidus]PZX34047.1 hypothetical protein C7416_101330 [Cupriavidus alkaliphilus]SOY65439.1 conserved hypothetical protein; putative membrane protein [Cupriavidus taiwanensis]
MASLGLTDATGLVGVAAYVAAHFAVQVLHKSPTGRLAVVLNVIGPSCILISLAGAFNLASFLTQCFWLALTLLGWWRNRRRGHSGRAVAETLGAPRPGQPVQQ